MSERARSLLREGWYLMSVHDLEIELARVRGEYRDEPSNALRISRAEAKEYKHAGNVPDALGRSLRLVLELGRDDVQTMDARRLEWEPDLHDAPTWRGPRSVPINIVPLRRRERGDVTAWWEDPAVAELEDEWMRTGSVAGIAVPGAYRGFVYKTVLALQSSGRPVTVDSIVDSVSRWLDGPQCDELRAALFDAND